MNLLYQVTAFNAYFEHLPEDMRGFVARRNSRHKELHTADRADRLSQRPQVRVEL